MTRRATGMWGVFSKGKRIIHGVSDEATTAKGHVQHLTSNKCMNPTDICTHKLSLASIPRRSTFQLAYRRLLCAASSITPIMQANLNPIARII